MIQFMKQKMKLKNRLLYIFLTFLFLIVILPLLIILFLINYFIRISLLFLSKCCRRDLVKLLPSRSSIFGIDYLSGQLRANIVTTFVLHPIVQQKVKNDGENLQEIPLYAPEEIPPPNDEDFSKIKIEDLRNLFLERVLNAKNKSTFLYPQLKQYIVSWGGFSWLKNESKFDISEHVKCISYSNVSVSGQKGQVLLKDLQNLLYQEPWTKGRSPWELILVEFDSKKCILLKTHHLIGDGYSILNMLIRCVDCDKTQNISDPKQKFLKKTKTIYRSKLKTIIRWIFFPIIATYEVFSRMGETTHPNDNPWRMKKNQHKNKHLTTTLPPIPLTNLKEIKYQFDVNLSSVILTIIAGAMRRSLLEKIGEINEINLEEIVTTPDFCQAILPWPVPRGKDKLENRLTFVILNLPIGNFCPVERLKMIEQQMNEINHSFFPCIISISIGLFGLLMNPILKFMSFDPTCIVSSFPGPAKQMTMFNHRIEEIYFQVGLANSTIGTGYLIMSYNDQLWTTVLLDKGVVTQNSSRKNIGELEINRLGDNILIEYEEFKMLANQLKTECDKNCTKPTTI